MRVKQNDVWMASLYIVSMVAAFSPRYGDFQINFRVPILIAAAWVILAFLKLAANGFRFKRGESGEGGFFLKLYLLPQIVIHLYTIALMIFGKVEWKYLGTNVTSYIPTLLATLSIYLFGAKAFRYNISAIILAWFASVGSSILMEGPGIIWDAIYQAYIDLDASIGANYLELHDMVLAIGYLICYYCVSREKWTTKNLWFCVMAVVIMILGMKRISVLAIAVVIVFDVVLKRFGQKRQYRICLACGLIGLVLCYLYVFVMGAGDWFYDLMAEFGINMKGRNYYYKDVLALSEFRVTYLGIGRNVVSKLLEGPLSYLRVGGVHSDIIKMYVESGFVMFGFWLWYYLLHIPHAYQKRYGYKPAVLYFTLVIYTFILYLTDNTENYFTCQILMILLPAYYAMGHREEPAERKAAPPSGKWLS